MELHERHRSGHPFPQGIAAGALDQVSGVGAVGQRDDAQLELAPVGHLGGAEHRVLAGTVGVEAQHEHLGQALEL